MHLITTRINKTRELGAMSLSYQNYHGQMLWIANNGNCRYVVSRNKAKQILQTMKARVQL
ncbi:conserved hypothetical protein [Vibrio crassostreae]|nr:hypothetical protein EDB30_102339 [Vibrio crassostreae]CAK2389042.1 conserved hypothetical protein [Vibrio crassostreae]CAK2586082.1 conserved hypothetical protein [Vibrio crassostreae]CAK2597724.1 conserved hypothetical protein [Vibrio crassostreae]CAK2784325.1 conserved hypothetical protein [Vibrio crassostreae]